MLLSTFLNNCTKYFCSSVRSFLFLKLSVNLENSLNSSRLSFIFDQKYFLFSSLSKSKSAISSSCTVFVITYWDILLKSFISYIFSTALHSTCSSSSSSSSFSYFSFSSFVSPFKSWSLDFKTSLADFSSSSFFGFTFFVMVNFIISVDASCIIFLTSLTVGLFFNFTFFCCFLRVCSNCCALAFSFAFYLLSFNRSFFFLAASNFFMANKFSCIFRELVLPLDIAFHFRFVYRFFSILLMIFLALLSPFSFFITSKIY